MQNSHLLLLETYGLMPRLHLTVLTIRNET